MNTWSSHLTSNYQWDILHSRLAMSKTPIWKGPEIATKAYGPMENLRVNFRTF